LTAVNAPRHGLRERLAAFEWIAMLQERSQAPRAWAQSTRRAPAQAVVIIGLFVFLALIGRDALAQRAVDIYAFVSDGCPHCEKAVEFLRRQAQPVDGVRLHVLELTHSAANRELFAAAMAAVGGRDTGVPTVLIGSRYVVGYYDDASTGAGYLALIEDCRARGCTDPVAGLLAAQPLPGASAAAQAAPSPALPGRIRVPLLGEIDAGRLSLPALTVLLAALDGFNPCAMWTLVFLIGLLLGLRDRTRMWVLGSAFIAASAFVYFLFMAAWLNLLLFLGAVVWVRAAIGVVALGGGAWCVREYFVNREAVCKVTAPARRREVFARLRALASEPSFMLALAGIVLLAFAVNLVEAVCSAGIPAVYSQVLALNRLPAWQYAAYIALYILVFMADDLLVFFAAMKTLQITGLSSRYTRASNLLGGVVLLALGALLLLRPDLLMFP
jgi:glutaredoxin